MSHPYAVDGIDAIHVTPMGTVEVVGNHATITADDTDTTRWALSGAHTGSPLAGTAGWLTVDLIDGTITDVSDTWEHAPDVELQLFQLEVIHAAGERTLVVCA